MSEATNRRDKLRNSAGALYGATRAAAAHYGAMYLHLHHTDDLVETFGAIVDLILAAEELADRATEAARTLRAALAEQMDECGATTVRTASHAAHIAAKPKSVHIQDETLLPPVLIRQPPPKPDLVEIGKLLRAGELVPGATLIGNGEPMLVIKARKD